MARKVFYSFTIAILISLLQADESLNGFEKIASNFIAASSDLVKALEKVTKECEELGPFSIHLTQLCNELKLNSDLLAQSKVKIDQTIKHYSEVNEPPVRTLSSSKDARLVSLLHTKIAANALITERIHTSNHRYSSFYELAQLLINNKFKVLVETGTARSGFDWCESDGCSTVVLGKIAQAIGAKLYSVDLDPNACARSREVTQSYKDSVQVIQSDSIAYLNSFDEGLIDFLYLDSYDYEIVNPNPSQEHHKKEILVAYNKLHKKSVVMVDDCRLENGGKCLLVRQFLLERGWSLYLSSYQQIFLYEQ